MEFPQSTGSGDMRQLGKLVGKTLQDIGWIRLPSSHRDLAFEDPFSRRGVWDLLRSMKCRPWKHLSSFWVVLAILGLGGFKFRV